VKIVGLKIEKGLLAVAVIDRRLGKSELAESYSVSFATDTELVEVLKEKARSWAGAKIVSSIPGHHFAQRTVEFPFADRKRVEKALPFEIEDSVPFELDDVVLDHLVLAGDKTGKAPAGAPGARILALLLPKTVLRQHLDLLASAGVDPQVIVPSLAGLGAVAPMIATEGAALLIAGQDLCLKSGNATMALRSLLNDGGAGGFRHVLQALETTQKERVAKALLLLPDSAVEAAVASAGIPLEVVVPEFGGRKPADAVSLGLALADGMNFRQGEFAYRAADAGVRKKRKVLIAAAAVVVVLAITNVAVKVTLVRNAYGRVDNAIKEAFRATFPGVRMTADPVRQMENELQEARKKLGVLGSGASVLDAMKTITEGVPREIRVSFTEFNYEGERVKLQGEAISFESVDKIKAELQKSPLFSDVVVQDTRMGVDNKVKFRIEIKLKEKM